MSPGEVGRAVGGAKDLVWLDVTGGEPLVRADVGEVFDEILQNAKNLCVLHFPTNGWYPERTYKLATEVRKTRPDVALIVTVSIDGPRGLHDQIRGRRGSFERAIKTFEALQTVGEGVTAYIGTTVTSLNEEALDALYAEVSEEARGFEVARWHINLFQTSRHYFANEGLGSLAAKDPVGVVSAHLRRRGLPKSPVDLMEWGFMSSLILYLKTGISVPCQALRSTCFISPEGDLYPCHIYGEPLGNVVASKLEDLWHSPKVLEARRRVEALQCKGCFTPCEAYPSLAGSPGRAVASSLAGFLIGTLINYASPKTWQGNEGSKVLRR